MNDNEKSKEQLIEEIQKLREERFIYQTVADFTYDWEVWHALDRSVKYISPSCERITGYPAEKFYEQPRFLYEITHPDDVAKVLDHYDHHYDDTEIKSIKFRIISKDGKEKWVEHYCQAITGEDGTLLGRRSSNRDVTSMMHSEMRRNAMNRIFREALLGETQAELAQTCLSVTEEITHSQFGFVGLINPNGRLDTIALSNPGWDACQVADSEAARMITDMELRGLWSRVIKDGRSFYTNSAMQHPDSVGVPEGHPPLERFLGIPLKDDGRTIGLIGLANKKVDYNDNDVETLEYLSVAIMEVMNRKKMEKTLEQQAQEILEVSTPILRVWQGVVVAPLIGTLDSQRTQRFMENLLNRIVDTKAEIALIDITGVPVIDTQTAQSLIDTISGVRLLGSNVILTGVRPQIAQTLVHLGIDLSDIITRSSLVAGFKVALKQLGYRLDDNGSQP